MPTLGTVLFIAGSFGPGIAAIAVVRYTSGQDGLRRWLRRSLQWRVGWRWLALSFFLPLAVIGLAAAMHIALGGAIAEAKCAEFRQVLEDLTAPHLVYLDESGFLWGCTHRDRYEDCAWAIALEVC